MASPVWIGRAKAVAQVSTVQVTAYDAATTYKLTVGDQVLSTIAAGGVNATATALAAAWNASTHIYHTGVTASAATDTVTLTSDTPGVPFTATSSVTGGTGTIGSVTTSTANAGPNVFGSAANWDTGVAPTTGDTAIYDGGDVDCLYDLDQSAVTLAELRIMAGYTGKIGLPLRSFSVTASSSDTTADEYRPTALKIGATLCNIGQAAGSSSSTGSGRINLDFSNIQTTVTVYSSASSATEGSGSEPIRLKGTHASNVLAVFNGIVGVATSAANEVATFSRISVGTAVASDFAGALAPKVTLGAGCTLTTLDQIAGTITNLGSNVTTFNQGGGVYTAQKSCTHTTINQEAGTFYWDSNGTITTANIAGTFDASRDPRTKTITTLAIAKGAVVNIDNGRPLSITLTNNANLGPGAQAGVNTTYIYWPNVTVALS